MSTALAGNSTVAVEHAEASLLDRIAEETQRSAARYMPTLSVKQFSEREQMLRELKALLVEGIDYGPIPGTSDKPVLLKPGAEKLCAFFGYAPHYTSEIIEDWDGKNYGEALFYYKYTCTLSKDGKPVGEGQGSCNSWESKYRYRNAGRTCPTCGIAAIIKGKDQYGGGWICFAKKGGCGAKYKDGDKAIEGQEVGRVPNPDFADLINTVQKMGQKRAMVAAVLSATGASQYFTQDLEDAPQPEPKPKAAPKATATTNRPVPEELELVIGGIRRGDYSMLKGVTETLKADCEAAGVGKRFEDMSSGLRASFPKGNPIPALTMESFLLDIWDAITEAKAAKATAPAEDDRAGWLPEGLFGEEKEVAK